MAKRHSRGSVRRQGNQWYLRQWVNGVESVEVIGTTADIKNKQQARAAADSYLLQLNPKAIGTGKQLTVAELAQLYAKHRIPMMKRTSGYSAASLINKHIVPHLGPTMLSDLDALTQQELITAMHAAQLSRKTIDNALAALSCMLDFARENRIPASPLDRKLIRLPPQELRKPRRYFTPDESARIVWGSEYPWRALYATLAMLGLRCGEVLGLRWLDIDFADKVVHVRQSAVDREVQTVKSKNSQADLPMPAVLAEILREYDRWIDDQPGERKPTGLLFEKDASGLPWKGQEIRDQQLYPLLKQLSIAKGGLHAFRHGVASNLFREGASAPAVKDGMRHGRIDTTMGYTHVISSDVRTAFDKNAETIHRKKPERSHA